MASPCASPIAGSHATLSGRRRLHHGGKRRETEAWVRKRRTWLGRLARDIARKIDGDVAKKAAFAETLGVVNRLLRQKRSDRGADKL